jgi:hypothetical protein
VLLEWRLAEMLPQLLLRFRHVTAKGARAWDACVRQ